MPPALNSVMTTLLSLFATTMLCGTAAMVFAMFNAPEGYEDESGFHIVWANNSPEIPDIACVWVAGMA
jgi:hypothetical protein